MNWFKTILASGYDVDYDSYRQHIEGLAQSNPYPFSNWFDENGRTYIPFSMGGPGQDINKDVQKELADVGCIIDTLEDYVGGYCQSGNKKMKIGKMLGLY